MSTLYNKALWAATAMMLYHSAYATVYTLTAFPSDKCDDLGYYTTFSTQDDSNSCTAVSFGTDDFELVNNNYQIYWDLKDEIDGSCEVALLGEPSSGAGRDCGECLGKISHTGGCTLIPVPQKFYVTWCCGTDCDDYCGAPAKRSLGSSWSEPVLVDRDNLAEPVKVGRSPNPAKVKSQPLLKKRDKCSFKGNGDVYDKAGAPVQVTDTINSCPSDDGCQVQYSGTVEQSFSQTFGVSSTTEAGFFDVVSESITFSYDSTYESSKSVTASGTFNVPKGEGGYVTFSPLQQCIKGTFSGDDCPKGVTIDKEGEACIPETLQGGKMPKGDLNLVISG